MFALHLEDENGELLSFVAINPKIVSHSVEKTYLTAGEGCLSVDRKCLRLCTTSRTHYC